MKRFWLLAFLMAGSLAVTTTPASAKAKKAAKAKDKGTADSPVTAVGDVNSALGSMAARLNDIDKILGLKFSGDVRVRWAFAAQGASQAGVTIGDSSRGRYRARLGVAKKAGDFTAKFRVATGSTGTPNSENNTFDTGFVNPAINVDTASITWEPSFANGAFSITAGKMTNPLTKTSITWDPDIQPEGVAAELKKGDFTFRAAYFELQNLYASGTTSGNMDLFMDNLQAEWTAKLNDDLSLGLMAGYEYIPNSTILLTSGTAINGTLAKTEIAYGNVLDNGQGRDWNNVEGMVYLKHTAWNTPFKWYLHLTDNLNGKNLPGTTPGTYTVFTNQYAWLLGVDIGALKNAGDWAGTLYAAGLDPNAQLAFLTDDDAGGTNRQYLFGSLSFSAEKGVAFKLSEWLVNHEYYSYVTGPSSLGGSSQNPEWVSYLDCGLSF